MLSQTPLPGIPISPSCTLPDIYSTLASAGATVLVDGLRAGVHVPPHIPRGWTPAPTEQGLLTHAPKITTADRALLPPGQELPDAGAVLRRARVLGPLWAYALVGPHHHQSHGLRQRKAKRIILEDIHEVPASHTLDFLLENPAASGRIRLINLVCGDSSQTELDALPLTVILPEDRVDGPVAIRLSGGYVMVSHIKVEGEKSRPAVDVVREFGSDPERS